LTWTPTWTASPTVTFGVGCAPPPSNNIFKVNLQVACTSQDTHKATYSFRIYNYENSGIVIDNFCIRAWAYESGIVNITQWGSFGTMHNADGSLSGAGVVGGSGYARQNWLESDCLLESGHYANQILTYCISSGQTIPPHGGYWESGSDAIQFGRSNPNMDSNDFHDD
jgi:hypothetical protein